jgi:hypothetical protein
MYNERYWTSVNDLRISTPTGDSSTLTFSGSTLLHEVGIPADSIVHTTVAGFRGTTL